ncbi:MAG: hypothetical protein HQ558_02050 [Candidatus Omnitrophica bacterium]|nr:hypothetical protein [Candidatus Omnitrophota bacterium]
MWWRWTVLIIGSILILACVISTTVDWIKGKTGPFGPKPMDWWGCGIFTILIALLVYWVSKGIFR